MHIISLDDATIAAGRSTLRGYLAAQVCGPDAAAYGTGMVRHTGLGVVVGSILECLDAGVTDRDSIVHAVARASRCRRQTVSQVLDAFCGENPRWHLWAQQNGHFYDIHEFTDIGDDWAGALIAA